MNHSNTIHTRAWIDSCRLLSAILILSLTLVTACQHQPNSFQLMHDLNNLDNLDNHHQECRVFVDTFTTIAEVIEQSQTHSNIRPVFVALENCSQVGSRGMRSWNHPIVLQLTKSIHSMFSLNCLLSWNMLNTHFILLVTLIVILKMKNHTKRVELCTRI